MFKKFDKKVIQEKKKEQEEKERRDEDRLKRIEYISDKKLQKIKDLEEKFKLDE